MPGSTPWTLRQITGEPTSSSHGDDLAYDCGRRLSYVRPMIRRSNFVIAALLWGAQAVASGTVVAGTAPQASPPASPPASVEPAVQGAYGDWSLYQFQENGNAVCYLASRIMKSSESVPGRRPSFVLITNRLAEGKRHVVSVVSGYSYPEGATVTVAIGRRQFHLFTDNDTAWAEDAVDPQIVQAIHGGSALTVSGRMKDGPAIVDNFSLKGAAEALTALDQACPMPGKPLAKTAHNKKRMKPQ